jgi:hypothetical protein
MTPFAVCRVAARGVFFRELGSSEVICSCDVRRQAIRARRDGDAQAGFNGEKAPMHHIPALWRQLDSPSLRRRSVRLDGCVQADTNFIGTVLCPVRSFGA